MELNKYQKIAKQALLSNPTAVESLKLFSTSDMDLALRTNAYMNAMAETARLEDIAIRGGAKRRVALFASEGAPGMGAANLRGTTIYPATILSYVSSIAPIFCVERSMDTPRADLQFMDFYSLVDGDVVTPNLGKDRVFGKNAFSKDLTPSIDGTTTAFSVATGVALIPNSVRIIYTDGTNKVEVIVDNGNMTLLGAPGLLKSGTVNYKQGNIDFEFNTAPATGAKLVVNAAQDTPAEKEVDKLAGESKYFSVQTAPVVIPIIRNIISDAALNKQGVIDPNTLYTNLIQTEYTKLINSMVVETLIGAFDGNTYTADLSSFDLAAGKYETFIRTFQSLIVDGTSILGQQTYKGSRVTGILASRDIANVFGYMTAEEGWTPNDQLAYFKDLVGWYKGIPVVRWEDSIEDGTMYLTHKTDDGQLAPCIRGMFITPTDLPEIGNFGNPSQITNGMFSLEGVRPTTSKLVVKIKVTLPESQFLKLQ